MTLRSAYFEKFDVGGAPNLLIWGNAAEIAELGALLRYAASANDAHLTPTPISKPVDGQPIVIRKSVASKGIVAVEGGFDWILDAETLDWFADLVAELAVSDHPGHQYLETSQPHQIAVRVSLDEYPDDFRP
jgi:hypothetical protein